LHPFWFPLLLLWIGKREIKKLVWVARWGHSYVMYGSSRKNMLPGGLDPLLTTRRLYELG
jgi:hypothetical protein